LRWEEDCLHELAVVLQYRGLTRVEAVRLRPAEAEAHLEIALLCGFVVRAGIVGYVEAGDADASGGADDRHEGVKDCGRGFLAFLALSAGFEADGVYCGVHFGLANDFGDEVSEIVALGEIDGSEANFFRVFEAVWVHVANHDERCAEDLG
jgi:hypothetical protein